MPPIEKLHADETLHHLHKRVLRAYRVSEVAFHSDAVSWKWSATIKGVRRLASNSFPTKRDTMADALRKLDGDFGVMDSLLASLLTAVQVSRGLPVFRIIRFCSHSQ